MFSFRSWFSREKREKKKPDCEHHGSMDEYTLLAASKVRPGAPDDRDSGDYDSSGSDAGDGD